MGLLEGAAAGNWSLGIVEQSQGEGWCLGDAGLVFKWFPLCEFSLFDTL